MTRRIPAYGITKDEHDEVVARTGRPFTQDEMSKRREDTDTHQPTVSLVDAYLSEYFKGMTA